MSSWIAVNKPYKKITTPLNLETLLKGDEEYTSLLDTILRKTYEELSHYNFDVVRYDFLTSAYLERKVPYEEWEFREEFENVCSKYQEINQKLELLLRPLYVKLEERKTYITGFIAKEMTNIESDSFVTMSLPKGTFELSVELNGKRDNIPLTQEVKKFIETFVDMDAMYVIAYRVVKKPSIFNRIGKRLGLCT